MPRPRFTKLSKNKQERILEAAAKEFAAHGYEAASLNRMLAEAGISKGAAYYYFDDKADLYATTLRHYSRELMANLAADSGLDLVAETYGLTADGFWAGLEAVYRRQFTSFAERPWVLGVTKADGSLSPAALAGGPLADVWQEAQSLLTRFLQHGRALGVIRDDLPDDLLLALVIGVDDVHDQWLFGHHKELSADDLDQAAHRISDILRRLLAPG